MCSNMMYICDSYFHFREQRAQAASQKISEYQAKEKARVAVSMNTRWYYT